MNKEIIESAEMRLLTLIEEKQSENERMKDNEKWWRLKHFDRMKGDVKPTSGWLFNSIINKHADAMDNLPTAAILPRSADDKKASELLSKVVPALLVKCDFEKVYSDIWWDKLKFGVGVYGVFWNPKGVGEPEIKRINPQNLYFSTTENDINSSSELFYLETVNKTRLLEIAPKIDLENARGSVTPEGNGRDRFVIVNWYYRKKGKLHFCRFAGSEVIFSSEKEKGFENGWYNHGRFPFVFDAMFPIPNSPLGFGFIDTMKNTQGYIDLISKAILENALLSSKKRFFLRDDGSINEAEFMDFSNPIIHCSGNLGEDSIREFHTSPLSDIYVGVLKHKIDEIKETSGNRDFSQGSVSNGVTAASAINALQEAGGKLSRDMLTTSYKAFRDVCYLLIELLRQFYTLPRMIRISGDEFLSFDNSLISEQKQVSEFGVEFENRLPVFDVIVKSQKGTPYQKAAINELALQLFNCGFFSPERRLEAAAAAEMMDFEGKPEVIKKLEQS